EGLRVARTRTGDSESGQTGQENVAGGPPSGTGGPETHASRTTRPRPPGPPPATIATPSAAGFPPATVTESRWGRSGCGTRSPTADHASPPGSAGASAEGSAAFPLIQPRRRSRTGGSTSAAPGTGHVDRPGPATGERPVAEG